jgi:hypothetical protein
VAYTRQETSAERSDVIILDATDISGAEVALIQLPTLRHSRLESRLIGRASPADAWLS